MRTRMAYGTRWWTQRWLSVFEEADADRMKRGRSYARQGLVRQLEVKGQRVTAKVSGSRQVPYRVEVIFASWSENQCRQLQQLLPSAADWQQQIAQGELPPMWLHLTNQAGTHLIPPEQRISLICTCPDWGWPCKHAAAVCCVLSERMEQDPLLLLRLQGLDTTSLGEVSAEIIYDPLPDDALRFWGDENQVPVLDVNAWPEGPLLTQLGGFPRLTARHLEADLLPIYAAASEHALHCLHPEEKNNDHQERE